MKRIVQFLVDMLPLDATGRRAVDETLADWRHEAGEAQTTAGRLVAGVRGAAAVTVAVASVAVRDVTSAETFRIAGLVVGAACLMAIGFSFRSFERHAAGLAERGLTDANLVGLWASMLPQALSFCIALALLAPPVRRVATRSLIGPCLLLMAMSAINLGWVAPLANQWFRQTTADMLGQSDSRTATERSGGHEGRPYDASATAAGAHVPRGLGEYTVIDLVRELRSNETRARAAVRNLNSRGAGLAMVPLCLILGVQARRIGAARHWKVGAGLLAWGTFIAGYIAAIFAVIAGFDLLGERYFLELYDLHRQYSVWLIPIVCASMAVALSRLVPQSPTPPALPS